MTVMCGIVLQPPSARLIVAVGSSGLRLLLLMIIQLGQAQRMIGDRVHEPTISDLYFTVNARYQTLELTWRNFNDPGGYIVLTEDFPVRAFEQKLFYYTYELPSSVAAVENSTVASIAGRAAGLEGSGSDGGSGESEFDAENPTNTTEQPPVAATTQVIEVEWEYDFRDQYGERKKEVLFAIKPEYTNGWTMTDIIFHRDLMESVDITTSCYGYYGYFISANGTILSEHCLKLYPTWMNDLRSHLGQFKMRELFIPGSHDSASYKQNFNPHQQENIVTKYTLTQDDDIRQQLLQGIRYIDLRVGYYKTANPPFWANHGISRLHPLKKILGQIRDYALETNEIIMVDVQEFPVGFGKKFDVHDKLIRLLNETLADVMADAGIGWYGRMEDIWSRNRTVIVSYDHEYAMRAYPHLMWRSAEQKWGNVQTLEDLKSYLFKVHKLHMYSYSIRPIADMAELTPDPWGVITDRYGGLRKMADSVNRFVTKWYFEELGPTANIVAVDFIRGTNIVDAAIYWNLKRVPSDK